MDSIKTSTQTSTGGANKKETIKTLLSEDEFSDMLLLLKKEFSADTNLY